MGTVLHNARSHSARGAHKQLYTPPAAIGKQVCCICSCPPSTRGMAEGTGATGSLMMLIPQRIHIDSRYLNVKCTNPEHSPTVIEQSMCVFLHVTGAEAGGLHAFIKSKSSRRVAESLCCRPHVRHKLCLLRLVSS